MFHKISNALCIQYKLYTCTKFCYLANYSIYEQTVNWNKTPAVKSDFSIKIRQKLLTKDLDTIRFRSLSFNKEVLGWLLHVLFFKDEKSSFTAFEMVRVISHSWATIPSAPETTPTVKRRSLVEQKTKSCGIRQTCVQFHPYRNGFVNNNHSEFGRVFSLGYETNSLVVLLHGLKVIL